MASAKRVEQNFLREDFEPISLKEFVRRTTEGFDEKNLLAIQTKLKKLVKPFSGKTKLNWVKEFEVAPGDPIYGEQEGYTVVMLDSEPLMIVYCPLYGSFIYHVGESGSREFGSFEFNDEGLVDEFRKHLEYHFSKNT